MLRSHNDEPEMKITGAVKVSHSLLRRILQYRPNLDAVDADGNTAITYIVEDKSCQEILDILVNSLVLLCHMHIECI